MSQTIEFNLENELKVALEKLANSGENVNLELQGTIINGELKIVQMDSKISQPPPHCWHALTDNTK